MFHVFGMVMTSLVEPLCPSLVKFFNMGTYRHPLSKPSCLLTLSEMLVHSGIGVLAIRRDYYWLMMKDMGCPHGLQFGGCLGGTQL